ncbi:MAG: helix-turn-helix domain-containing protein [Saccharofermentanales bacterium]
MQREDEYKAVSRMQEYVGSHLQEPITLKQLADEAGYSPWHSARLFKELTGKPPFDYIRALRLSKAALALRDGKSRIIDTAFDFVFDSHEGFTRAFSREFGLPPKKYSMSPPPIRLFMPAGIMQQFRYLEKLESPEKGSVIMSERNEPKAIFVQVVERPARRLLLKRGVKATDYFEYCDEVGCDIWPLLCSVKEAIYEPVGLWLPGQLVQEGTSVYVQGVELPADYSGVVPEGYDLIDLPPCKMMIFQSEPYNDDDFMDEIGIVWDKIAAFDPTVYGYRWADDAAPRFQLEPLGYRGYIEGRPVAALNV